MLHKGKHTWQKGPKQLISLRSLSKSEMLRMTNYIVSPTMEPEHEYEAGRSALFTSEKRYISERKLSKIAQVEDLYKILDPDNEVRIYADGIVGYVGNTLWHAMKRVLCMWPPYRSFLAAPYTEVRPFPFGKGLYIAKVDYTRQAYELDFRFMRN